MTKTRSKLALGLFSVLSILPLQSAQAAPWKTIAPKNANFSVSLPGTPKATKNVDKDKDGSVTTDYDWSLEQGVNFYMVGYQEHPASTAKLMNGDALLDEVVKSMMGESKGKITRQKKIALSGFPGREVMATTPDGVALAAKLFWAKNRLYLLMGGHPTKDAAAAKNTNTFLQSFKLQVKP
jgi:hypothetical protein